MRGVELEQSSYGMRIRTSLPYESALAAIREALKQQGFGVLTEIDVQKTLKEKLNVDFRSYVILGACNPPFAHKALEAEIEIGLLLPCNVIVYEDAVGCVIAAMDPVKALFAVVENPALAEIAMQVRSRLEAALQATVSG
jgi:uncharacterized protein (DUF302 family)